MRKTFALFLSFMLLLSACLPFTVQVEAANISDVSTTNGKYTAINWAVDNGLMSLYIGNKFDMNGNVTEAEMLSMFAKLDANYKLSVTTDMTYLYYADLNIPLQGALSKAKRDSLVTRGDFAVIYAAMRGLDLSEVHAVQNLYTNEITTGTGGKKTYESYNPTGKLTRGDIAVFLYRMVQKGKFAVEGLKSAATGKDDSKVTLPVNFVSSQGTTVDLEQPKQNTSDVSPNTPNATKTVQSVEVEKKKLNANGYDTTLVTVKFKDSRGNTIPYDQSLKFKVSSEYFDSSDFGKYTQKVAKVTRMAIVDNTTVELTFNKTVSDITASEFKIEGLEIKNATIKSTDATTVVLKTGTISEADKPYTVSINSTKAGTFYINANQDTVIKLTGEEVKIGPAVSKYKGNEIFQAPTAVTSPNGQSTAIVESDGGELNFFYRAPRMTKGLKDNIIIELADSTAGSNYSSFKNSQIKVPIEYIVEPELRVTYEVFDGENYVGGGDGGQDQSAPAYPSDVMKQGPITVSGINDDGTLTVQSVAIKPQYQYAKLTLAQREISEQMFERIVSNLLDNSGTGTVRLDYYADENGNAAYNIPFSYIPNEYTSKFGSNEPQEYAVLLYLYKLLPDKISEFSMADYKSVKSAQAIAQGISEAEIQNSSYKDLRSVINGINALAELADQTKADEDAAKRPGDMASYTKIAVTLVAPGGQIITNYRGQVTIEYKGKKKTVPFNRSSTSDGVEAGQAVAYFEGVTYGKSTAKITFSPETDSRYEKLLKGLEGKVVEKEIIAQPPLNMSESCNRAQTLGVLVDESGSMKKADPYNIVNTETTKLMNQLEVDPTYAFGFNTKGRFASEGMPLTPSNSIFDYKYRGGGTSLVKGFEALQPYLKKEEGIGNIPKALIIVTDGNFSATVKNDIITFAKNNNIKIYTIAVGQSKDINASVLKDIAMATEGEYFHLSDINNITNIYNSLMKSLCMNYTEACPANFDSFQQADVTIGRTYLFIEAEANCGNVEKVKVKFYSVNGELELDLKYIGLNMFELEHDIRKIHNFSIYEDVEFFAYDKEGNLLTSKKVKIQ